MSVGPAASPPRHPAIHQGESVKIPADAALMSGARCGELVSSLASIGRAACERVGEVMS
jgi:hypothetical protein